jgi:cell division protein FtsB
MKNEDEINHANDEEVCSRDEKVVNIEYHETDTYAIQNIQDEMDSMKKTVKMLKKKIKKMQKGFHIDIDSDQD